VFKYYFKELWASKGQTDVSYSETASKWNNNNFNSNNITAPMPKPHTISVCEEVE
jgi:hypothetical protein